MLCFMLAIACFLTLPVNITLADGGGDEPAPAEPIDEGDQGGGSANQTSVASDDNPQVDGYVVFLPLTLASPGNTTTTPPAQGNEVDGVIGYFRSNAQDYDAALRGEGIREFDQNIYNRSPYSIRIGQLGEKPEGFPYKYEVIRGLFDFDTTTLTVAPSEVYLHVKIVGKTANFVMPQVVHRGTWRGLAAYELNLHGYWYLWTAFDRAEMARFLTTESQGVSEDQPLELYIPLPVDFVQGGDYTHLVIRSGEEGTPPPTAPDAWTCAACARFVEYSQVDLIIVQ
jgi:hypothetical protein